MRILLITLLLSNVLVYGQSTIINTSDSGGDFSSNLSPYNSQIVIKKATKSRIKGHVYNEESNKLATIYIGKRKSTRSFVRYNAFNGEMEMTVEGGKVYNMIKRDGVKVVLDDGYTYTIFDHEGLKQFFVVKNKNKGRFSLLLKIAKKIKQGRPGRGGYGNSIPSKYIEDNKYFIFDSEKGEMMNVKLKKKEILHVLGKKNEIEKFTSSNKLSYKKEKHIVKIINYYNTLL
ncbi:hypothetical protein [Aquimarina longa]|uniref:hypothetical protein n=1 Tax=Aquimarina longa TaxID=1080221 RepID=UPI000781A479|nr:hypothetical protein [Aquimarina longa]